MLSPLNCTNAYISQGNLTLLISSRRSLTNEGYLHWLYFIQKYFSKKQAGMHANKQQVQDVPPWPCCRRLVEDSRQPEWCQPPSPQLPSFPCFPPNTFFPLICLHLPVAKGGRAPAAPVADGCSTAAAAAWDVLSTGANGPRSRDATKVYAAVEELAIDQL